MTLYRHSPVWLPGTALNYHIGFCAQANHDILAESSIASRQHIHNIVVGIKHFELIVLM